MASLYPKRGKASSWTYVHRKCSNYIVGTDRKEKGGLSCSVILAPDISGQEVVLLLGESSLTSELRLDFGSSRLASVAAWEAKAYGVTCWVGGLPNQSPWLLAVAAGLDKGRRAQP